MTGTKGHSGGKRPGQGRKPKPGNQYHITIRCDEETYEAIIQQTTPEERAKALLLATKKLVIRGHYHDYSFEEMHTMAELITVEFPNKSEYSTDEYNLFQP